jgi:ABC-type transport system involved in multi-copper enzyme maturation permease subunit
MAVNKRSYRLYTGGLTPEWSRFLVITRHAFVQMFDSRFFIGLLVVAFVPVLFGAVTIYLANTETARLLLNINTNSIITINELFFVRMLQAQGWIAMLLTAYIGPTLVASDLSHNALPLYLSRPISRTEYVLGKAAVIGLLLSFITWVPGLLLFLMQAGMAPSGWLRENYWIAGSIFLGAAIWIAFLSLFSLALSAWVKWRIVATGLTFAAFFLPAGFGQAINEVLRTYWGGLLNLPYIMNVIWFHLFRTPLRWRIARFGREQIPVSAAWAVLIVVCCISMLLLNQRLRAREVVRG